MKQANELPVAVRIFDRHGLVSVVRVTPSGNAFVHQVARGKARTNAIENFPEEISPEFHAMAMQGGDARRDLRRFLDDIEDDELVTYCSKGRHDVPIPVGELRSGVEAFKEGAPPMGLSI